MDSERSLISNDPNENEPLSQSSLVFDASEFEEEVEIETGVAAVPPMPPEKLRDFNTNGTEYDPPDEFNNFEWTRHKGRQGRSKANRELKRAEAELRKKLFGDNALEIRIDRCDDCNSSVNVVEDRENGISVCDACGRVCASDGFHHESLISWHEYILGTKKSKPYQRVVHFNTRLSQLLAQDPDCDHDFLRQLYAYVRKNAFHLESIYGSATWWGPHTWKDLLRNSGLKYNESATTKKKGPGNPEEHEQGSVVITAPVAAKLATHWIQLRKWCHINPWRVELSPEVKREMKWRCVCVSLAFDHTIRYTSDRKNIIAINYMMAQILRLTSPEDFRAYARFIPLVKKSVLPPANLSAVRHWKSNPNQTLNNNTLWKTLVEFCAEHHKNPIEFGLRSMDWTYHPITQLELDTIFNKFI